MFLNKRMVVLFGVCAMCSFQAIADGVFLDKKETAFELSPAEQRQLTIEFYEKFGAQKKSPIKKSNNPWQAKKERTTTQDRSISWSECRDYALQKRNSCYKQGKEAYHCERFYEARTSKCNKDF